MVRRNRYYLPPDVLNEIPIEGLTSEQVGEAINRRCDEERVHEAAEEAAKILQAAGIKIDAEAVARLEKLVK